MTTAGDASAIQTDSKRYLTVKQAAELLCVDIKTIYRAVAAGELPARRIGRVLRVPRSAVVSDGDVR